MSKRIVCLILALILFVGLIPAGAISASAASNRTVSENAVKFIKDWEGYTKTAYADGMENGAQIDDGSGGNMGVGAGDGAVVEEYAAAVHMQGGIHGSEVDDGGAGGVSLPGAEVQGTGQGTVVDENAVDAPYGNLRKVVDLRIS